MYKVCFSHVHCTLRHPGPLPRVTMMLLFILNSSYYLSLAIPVNSGLCFFLIDVYQTADEVRCHGARSVTINKKRLKASKESNMDPGIGDRSKAQFPGMVRVFSLSTASFVLTVIRQRPLLASDRPLFTPYAPSAPWSRNMCFTFSPETENPPSCGEHQAKGTAQQP